MFAAKALLIAAAALSGPTWLASTARAQTCNYSCGNGAYLYSYNEYASGCGDEGSICYYTICGGTCYNSQGQACSPGPYNPPGCFSGVYEIESCQGAMPCGCSYFCSQ